MLSCQIDRKPRAIINTLLYAIRHLLPSPTRGRKHSINTRKTTISDTMRFKWRSSNFRWERFTPSAANQEQSKYTTHTVK